MTKHHILVSWTRRNIQDATDIIWYPYENLNKHDITITHYFDQLSRRPGRIHCGCTGTATTRTYHVSSSGSTDSKSPLCRNAPTDEYVVNFESSGVPTAWRPGQSMFPACKACWAEVHRPGKFYQRISRSTGPSDHNSSFPILWLKTKYIEDQVG